MARRILTTFLFVTVLSVAGLSVVLAAAKDGGPAANTDSTAANENETAAVGGTDAPTDESESGAESLGSPDEPQFVLVDRTADLGQGTSKPREDGVAIDHVILHFMSAVNVQPEAPFDIDACLGIFNEYGVSAHYVVGRDGTVYHAVADERVAYHAGRAHPKFEKHRDYVNMNGRSIGIELLAVGSRRDMTTGKAPMMSRKAYREFASKHPEAIGYTDEQYAALTALLLDLSQRHPIALDRKHLRGHSDYAGPRKKDPGELFDWKLIREAIRVAQAPAKDEKD